MGASRFQRVEGSQVDWTVQQRASRPVQEYLVALESENSPTNPEREPKALSPCDPAAAWTTRGRHKVMFGYSLNYRTLTHPTYGTGEMLGWLVDHGIDPHIPVWDKSHRDDGTFSTADFTYNEERDLYVCPGGKTLKTTGRVHDGKTLYYRASKLDCEACPLKARCCPKSPARRISRDVNEKARDYTRALMVSEAYALSSAARKIIEALFAEAKQIQSLVRLRLRGLTGARDEFLLTATVQNLKRLAQHSTIPPPWGASGFGETSGCGRRNRNWRTKEWIHRLPMMSVRSRRARRSAPIELAEASPSAGRRGDFRRSGNSKLSAG